MVVARESTNPRLAEGMSWEKRRKDSICLKMVFGFNGYYVWYTGCL